MADKKSENSDDEILRLARERFKLAEEAWAQIRADALDDLKFSTGDQWPEKIKADRQRENRPCLVVNRAPQFIRQITNEQRQNRPAIKVNPVDDLADVEVARVLQGMIRHIEYDSNADIAYDTGFDGAVRKSFGFWRIITEYVSPRSFDQQLKIKSIRNAFSVLLDPHFKEPDGSDANYGFILEDVPNETYKADYKDSKLCDGHEWSLAVETSEGWVSESTVRVAEYFTKDFKEIEIVLLSNGQVVTKADLDKQFPDGTMLPEGIQVKDKRKSIEPVVKWYKINGTEILERTDWLGKWIPIIPAFGDLVDIEGSLKIESIYRHAKDSQRMLNLWTSAETEAIGLAPKAPWIVAEGQIEGYEELWRSANTKNHAVLPYKPVDLNGTPVPPPQRNSFEPAVQAITQARMQASEDLKATTGIYDSAMGARSNETSGIAIRGRQQQAQTSNFHFIDNLNRSIKHTARILVDLIPKVYDTARMARIIGDEGQEEIVKINQAFQEHGEEKIYDLSKGKYDVTVETGPNFQTRRQEAVASMLDLTKSMPQQAALIIDLLVKNMDIPGASEMAERFKKQLPPGIAEDSKEKAPVPPEAQAKLQQMDQMIHQLTEHLNQARKVIDTKSNELESKERIEFKRMETQLIIEQMKLQGAAANQVFAAELESINQRLGYLDMDEPINQEQEMAGAPDQALPPQEQQQPTGGLPPGNNMGV